MDPTTLVVNNHKYDLGHPIENKLSDGLVKSIDKTNESSNVILGSEANKNTSEGTVAKKTFTFSKRPKISEADIIEKESMIEKKEGNIKFEEGALKKEEGIVEKEVGLSKEEEGVHEKEVEVLIKEEGVVEKEVGLNKEEEGVHEKEEGVLIKEEGSVEKEVGLSKEEEGVHEKEEGIVEKEVGNRKEGEGTVNEGKGINEKKEGKSVIKLGVTNVAQNITLKKEAKVEASISQKDIIQTSIEKVVVISNKDKCEEKLKNTFILNGDLASGTFTSIVTEYKNRAHPNLSKVVILGQKKDDSGRYKATIFQNSGHKAGVEFQREGKTYVTEFATAEEEKEFLSLWGNYLTALKNTSKDEKIEEKNEKGVSHSKESGVEIPLQFNVRPLDLVKNPQLKDTYRIISEAILQTRINWKTKIQKEDLNKEVESGEIKNKILNYIRRKSEISTNEIFNETIQERDLEQNHSVALNRQHELVPHRPKQEKIA
ncbi:MAG: hypothetical protein H0T62_07040 [Parachlamydiaceae bacterium]|nr:hypothetical protein [Parachlamydiaceae bacterium]